MQFAVEEGVILEPQLGPARVIIIVTPALSAVRFYLSWFTADGDRLRSGGFFEPVRQFDVPVGPHVSTYANRRRLPRSLALDRPRVFSRTTSGRVAAYQELHGGL